MRLNTINIYIWSLYKTSLLWRTAELNQRRQEVFQQERERIHVEAIDLKIQAVKERANWKLLRFVVAVMCVLLIYIRSMWLSSLLFSKNSPYCSICCNTCYFRYLEFAAHLLKKHTNQYVTWTFVCSQCLEMKNLLHHQQTQRAKSVFPSGQVALVFF